MSKRVRATLLGAFVMGALALLVAGLLIIGSGRLGGDRETFVLFFRYSTAGLTVGAPVVLKGVQIGVVKDITVVYDDKSDRFQVPVYIEIDQHRVQWPEEIRGELGSRELYELGLKSGLRARLGLQSLVTGMRQIEIGFFPHTPLILSGNDLGDRELPTIPPAFDRLLGQVESLPLGHIVEQVLAILEGLNRLVNAKEMPRTLGNLDAAASHLAQLGAKLQTRIDTTGDKLDGTLSSLDQAAEAVRRLAEETSTEIGPVAKSLRGAGDSAQVTLGAAKGVFEGLDSAVGAGSPLQQEALSALRAVTGAARALRDLADYLERHPEALIRGKH